MVKVNKNFTLDGDLVDKLKEEGNASLLINNLLIDYFGSTSRRNIDELRHQMKGLRKEIFDKQELMEEISQSILNLEIKEKAHQSQFKSIPKEILEDFKFYNFSEDSLTNRWKDIYKAKYDIKLDLLLDVWKSYNENQS
jgi:hypothetical protein|tara:strand:+ start:190 stop:606 length:417 start_codon:yes stop_codon:yes gene_type:complete